MNVRTVIAIGFAAFVPIVASCGGSQPPPAPPPPPAAPAPTAEAPPPPPAATTPPPAPEAHAAPTAWKDMNDDQKKAFMKTVVYPKMKEAFIGYDAKRYAEMNCMTCHGEGAKEGHFKMPNAKLPKLPSDEAGFKKLAEKKPAAAKFMMEKVVPEMASMLGETPMDRKAHTGTFGCKRCHTTQ